MPHPADGRGRRTRFKANEPQGAWAIAPSPGRLVALNLPQFGRKTFDDRWLGEVAIHLNALLYQAAFEQQEHSIGQLFQVDKNE